MQFTLRGLAWLFLFPTAAAIAQTASVPLPREPAAAERNLRPAAPEPLPPQKLEAAIARGIEHLCRTQNSDGSWGSPRWTGGVDNDPVPGAFHSFSAAVTALALEALLRAAESPGEAGPQVSKAAEQAEAYLLENLPKLRRADPGNLPNIWGHCYGIQVLCELHRRTTADDSARRHKLEEIIRGQMALLARFETVHGGWFYYASGLQRPLAPSASFVNAAVLIAVDGAKPLGLELDRRVLDRALTATSEQRTSDSSYLYSMRGPLDKGSAVASINRPAGSLGRSQACNLALRLWGDQRITDQVLKDWLDRLITRNGWLDHGRKRPIPHEAPAAVAGYFFYFGHYYAALCIGELPAAERPFYQDHVGRLLIGLQEADGSWYDYPLYSYHKPYGTAFALMSLVCCRKAKSE